MRSRRRLRAVILFATAAAGLIGGHLLGYLFAIPNARARQAVLAWTGHGYLSKAVTLILASTILAGLAAGMLGVARARGGERALRFGEIAGRLVLLQVAGFLSLEVFERLLAGVPVSDLWGPVLGIGLPLQFLVAGLGALVLAAIARIAAAVALALAPELPGGEPASLDQAAPVQRAVPSRPLLLSRVTRGPPLVPVN